MPGQPVLKRLADYDALYRQFRWPMPATYNIGVEVCDRWADLDPRRTALLDSHGDGRCDEISYGALRDASNRLANALRAFGVTRGDRVAILLPQGPDVAVSHIAIYKLAAIALPLAMLFGVDAISYRLRNSGAKALITMPRVSPSSPIAARRCRTLCSRSTARATRRSPSTTRSRALRPHSPRRPLSPMIRP